MANKTIAELTAADALDGGELVHLVQGGNSRKSTVNNVVAFLAKQMGVPTNLSIVASVASNALTIELKGLNGADPSASNPVYVPFPDATAASGDLDVLEVVGAAALTISNGSTMGFTSGQIGRLWVVGFDDAGTFRLGAVKCLSGQSILGLRDGIYSSSAEGGAGGADSAQVIYSAAAVTSKPMIVLGYVDITAATAGVWSSAPSRVVTRTPGTALPGEEIAASVLQSGALGSATATIPVDNTIPQSSEGAQYMEVSITPKSGANLLRVAHNGVYSNGLGALITVALFRDSDPGAIAAIGQIQTSSDDTATIFIEHAVLAASESATTFKIRAGNNTSAALRINGFAGAAVYGGVAASVLRVSEIMA